MDITKFQGGQLPAKIEELHAFILVGKEKLKAHKARISAIEKLDMANTAKGAALSDAQDLAETLLQAESKLGELLAVRPKQKPLTKADGTHRGTIGSLPPGISKKQSHHAQVISGNPEVVAKVAQRAREQERLPTAEEVYREVKKAATEQKHEGLRSAPLPQEKFMVILADPPWKYDNTGFDEAANNQYPSMTVDEICNLNIKKLATDRSVLFLWATNPLLQEALDVLGAWGFSYKTNMAWVKDKARGKGWILKSKHELLLIGFSQNTPHPADRPDSCFEADRGKIHSRKPDESYSIIERMYPGPLDETHYLELFARHTRMGWKAWGNEV